MKITNLTSRDLFFGGKDVTSNANYRTGLVIPASSFVDNIDESIASTALIQDAVDAGEIVLSDFDESDRSIVTSNEVRDIKDKLNAVIALLNTSTSAAVGEDLGTWPGISQLP